MYLQTREDTRLRMMRTVATATMPIITPTVSLPERLRFSSILTDAAMESLKANNINF